MSSVIRHATVEDIEALALNVRQPDIEEVWASAHTTPARAMRMALQVSRDTTFAYEREGELICIFGVRVPSMLSEVAVPWMIASNKIEFASRAFLRESKKIISALSEQFPYMHNYVDARNTVAIRWLQWVGFSVYYPEPHGEDKLPFHHFEMIGDSHV